ncbi:hypothetical protein SPHINGOAX6_70317 [Sphingomonas sp. AX6]|nr:hypothetical protein SPHINGOAX6_70317 [Sphingomonas sp. AX6]
MVEVIDAGGNSGRPPLDAQDASAIPSPSGNRIRIPDLTTRIASNLPIHAVFTRRDATLLAQIGVNYADQRLS